MCEIAKQLELVHKWTHRIFEALSKEEIAEAEELGSKVLDLLNDGVGAGKSNGIKLVALYNAIASGIDHLEAHAEPDPPEAPVTIH